MTTHEDTSTTVRVHADHTMTKHLGNWTTGRIFEVRARRGAAVIDLRSPGIAQWDFAAVKNFSIAPEARAYVQFRAEFFNIFNRVQFGFPNQTQGNSAFGQITSQQNLPRLVQFALRLNF